MPNYIIVDLEATCTDTNEFPKEEMEIIEIGAMVFDSFPLETFQSFVRPSRNPILTEFCRELTGIAQLRVDNARPFHEVLGQFRDFIDGVKDPVFCSWGAYDKNQLLKDCNWHDESFPFSNEHINIRKMFSKYLSTKKRHGVSRALAHFNLEFQGSKHRGLDDALNIARIFSRITEI